MNSSLGSIVRCEGVGGLKSWGSQVQGKSTLAIISFFLHINVRLGSNYNVDFGQSLIIVPLLIYIYIYYLDENSSTLLWVWEPSATFKKSYIAN